MFGSQAVGEPPARGTPNVTTSTRVSRGAKRLVGDAVRQARRLLGPKARAQVAAMNLGEAMTSRAVIDMAKGIVMGERKCGPDAAFEHLRRISQTEHRKLRDVAQDLIDQVTTLAPAAGQEP